MKSVVTHIEYLLSKHDCVVIPGIGAILASHVQSQNAGNTFIAPRREYTFNGDLTSSDGLIASSMATAGGCSYRDASAEMNIQINAMKESLTRDGKLTLGRIGDLTLTDDGNYTFAPGSRDVISPLAGWIGNINAVRVEDRSSVQAAVRKDYGDTLKPQSFRVAHYLRTIAGAAAAVLILLIASTPISVKDTYQASMSLPPIVKPTVVHKGNAVQKEIPVTVTKAVATPVQDTKKQDIQPEVHTVKKNDTVPAGRPADVHFNVEDPYVVVVASLTTPEDADTYIAGQQRKNKDLRYGVVYSSGHYRVYAATGANARQAAAMASNPVIAERYNGAWVSRRN